MPYKSASVRRTYQRDRRARIRREWIETNGPCRNCGSTDRLEVDHIDPTTKRRHRDHEVWSWSPARRVVELAKCQVLCFRCHNEKSAAEGFVRELTHGTRKRYSKGCRCDPCKAANAEAARRWRANKAADERATTPER